MFNRKLTVAGLTGSGIAAMECLRYALTTLSGATVALGPVVIQSSDAFSNTLMHQPNTKRVLVRIDGKVAFWPSTERCEVVMNTYLTRDESSAELSEWQALTGADITLKYPDGKMATLHARLIYKEGMVPDIVVTQQTDLLSGPFEGLRRAA